MSQHASRVRALYKALLKLHRGLPIELQALGTQYVKEEFHLHKNIKTAESEIFLHEWTKYYVTLAGQLAKKRQKKQDIGSHLSPEMMDNFTEEQLVQWQLWHLCRREYDTLGFNHDLKKSVKRFAARPSVPSIFLTAWFVLVYIIISSWLIYPVIN
ncbi:Succinate dehydrogenase assembly factor 3, mitochondrial [Bulinus truncatus]|nr:Succinate dehydrogenase assembly factor 3, mitochondrial [Bulinus truncatus]